MNLLERAIVTAATAHAGQVDLQGAPYILHPLRVMLRARAEGMRIEAQAAAVLHDVVEDTPVTLADIERHISPETARLVSLLTKRFKGEPYEARIARASSDAEARTLKRYDIEDNLSRADTLPPEKAGLVARYRKALATLLFFPIAWVML